MILKFEASLGCVARISLWTEMKPMNETNAVLTEHLPCHSCRKAPPGHQCAPNPNIRLWKNHVDFAVLGIAFVPRSFVTMAGPKKLIKVGICG